MVDAVAEVERRSVLDSLARSLAILSLGAPALDREQTMRLVAELEEAERRLADDADQR